jgi:hypothetical protein
MKDENVDVPWLATYRRQANRSDALRVFFDALDAQEQRIARTIQRAEDIYGGRTPDRPFLQFDVTNVPLQRRSAWATTDLCRLLDGQLQWNLFHLEALRGNDFVPSLMVQGGSAGCVPELFGVEFVVDGTAYNALRPVAPTVRDLSRDLEGLEVQDVRRHRNAGHLLASTSFLAEQTEGRVEFVYPQLGGPMNSACRIMEECEALMAMIADPEGMRRLLALVGDATVAWMNLVLEAAGGPSRVRPRRRFYQPGHVKSVMVDDWTSVANPRDYLAVTAPCWQKVTRSVGPAFLHTCGPVLPFIRTFQELPGLAGFEAYFTTGRERTTEQMLEVKEQLGGRRVFCALYAERLPHPVVADDEKNATAEWLRQMSRDGGFMLNIVGTREEGVSWMRRFEIE